MCFVDRWSVHISWMWTLNIIFTSVMLNGKHWTFEPLNIRYCDMMPHAPCLWAAPPCAWQMDCRWTFNSWMWTFYIRNRHTSNIKQSAANIWYQKLKSNEQQTSDMLPLYGFQVLLLSHVQDIAWAPLAAMPIWFRIEHLQLQTCLTDGL